jgi:RNA polymerase sigma-70 factor (ECF subfamily)
LKEHAIFCASGCIYCAGGAKNMAVERRLQFVGDRELVEIARLGSLEACDELVRRFRGAVLLVAEQVLSSPEAAQDVAQEAFLLAFQALPKLQDPTKFAGWLCAIARNRARRVVMRERRSEATEADSLERLITAHSSGRTPGPLDELLRAETQAHIRTLLADLSPDLQMVMQLFYYEQWPTARIAEFLSLPLSTIKWRLHTGRNQLSRRLAAILEEKPHGRERTKKERGTSHAYPATKDGGDGRTRRADGQLRKRCPQLRQTLQCDCRAS